MLLDKNSISSDVGLILSFLSKKGSNGILEKLAAYEFFIQWNIKLREREILDLPLALAPYIAIVLVLNSICCSLAKERKLDNFSDFNLYILKL